MTTETETQVSPAAVAAANWWAEAIGAPKFDTLGDTRDAYTGDDRRRIESFEVMAMMGAGLNPVSGESAEAFAEALARSISAQDSRYRVALNVDYGPDLLLSEAAQAASVSPTRFPFKTNMSVYADHVIVSAGYRAQMVLVWASEEWLANAPACGAQKWDAAKPLGEPFACASRKYHEGLCDYSTPVSLCRVCGHREDWYDHSEAEREWNEAAHAFDGAPEGETVTPSNPNA